MLVLHEKTGNTIDTSDTSDTNLAGTMSTIPLPPCVPADSGSYMSHRYQIPDR